VHLYVLDERLRPVPAGVVGEIYLLGPGRRHGYVKRPGLTAERSWPAHRCAGQPMYRTGDLAHRTGEGRLIFDGVATSS